MAIQLTPEEFNAIKTEFLELDRNGDGRISRSEIQRFFPESNQINVDFMMRLMDLDSKEFDLSKFEACCKKFFVRRWT